MIVKSVVLRCDAARAFDLFTLRASEWWPADRRHTKDPSSVIRMEATGRFYERGTDGNEVELGIVRVYEPMKRLVLDWFPGTGPLSPTQVEVTFDSINDGTRVTIVHGPGAAGLEMYSRKAPTYAMSWDLVLAALAAHE